MIGEEYMGGEPDHGEFKVTLRVWHLTLTGEEIVAIVQREPKVVKTVGQPRATAKGKPMKGTYPTSFCTFELGNGTIPELEAFLLKEASQCACTGQLSKLIEDEGARMEFFIGVFLRDNTGFVLPAETSGKLAKLGIDLSFDMYCDQED